MWLVRTKFNSLWLCACKPILMNPDSLGWSNTGDKIELPSSLHPEVTFETGPVKVVDLILEGPPIKESFSENLLKSTKCLIKWKQ